MKIHRARKIRIYPNAEQRTKIDVTLNCCRYVYNKMLERNIKAYERRKKHLSYYDMQNLLPGMKEYLPWLKDADSQALKQSCRALNTAYDKFFHKQAGYPKFHSKRGRQSYTTTNMSGALVLPNKVKIPCLGMVKTSDKRSFSAKICYMTISRESNGKYYLSITYEAAINIPVVHPDKTKIIGFDYKSNGLYADSNGTVADMPHYYREEQNELKKLQRQLAKKVGSQRGEKKSHNYLKLLRHINKKHCHTAHQREDYLHKLSTEIANQYDAVCVETLDLRAMANAGFGNGKATNDNGYGMFLFMLGYKLAERGKQLIRVGKFCPSSQICHNCGHQQKMPLDVRTYICPECGMVCDRDYNAAINIRDEGMRILGLA